ncbi:hypothetical protein V1525DRAFT_409839 [Lipomyces kononenkoae]|uniref:Uncharacterized protein n=1 Tax=Lipomyces kononenkoae TaxID=34357 RepID=A0ACC3SV11_LIPKO
MMAADTSETTTPRRPFTPPPSDYDNDNDTADAAGIRILRDMMAAVRVCHPDNVYPSDEKSNTNEEKSSFAPDRFGSRCAGHTAVRKFMNKTHPPNFDERGLCVLTPTSTNSTDMSDDTLTADIVENMKALTICRENRDLEKQSCEIDNPRSARNRLTLSQRLRACVTSLKKPQRELNEKFERDSQASHHTPRCKSNFPERAVVAILHRAGKVCAHKVEALRALRSRGTAAVLAMTATLSDTTTTTTGNITEKLDDVKVKVEPVAPVSVSMFTPPVGAPAPAPAPPFAGPSHWPAPAVAVNGSKQHVPQLPSAERQGVQQFSETINPVLSQADVLSAKSIRNRYNDDEDDQHNADDDFELELPSIAAVSVLDYDGEDVDIEELAKFFDEPYESSTPTYLKCDDQLVSATSSSSPPLLEASTTANESADLGWAPLRPVAADCVSTTMTNRYTTPFAQQVLMHRGFLGPLDSFEALNEFNNVIRSGVPLFGPPLSGSSSTAVTADEPTTPPLVGVVTTKPNVIHVPAFAPATTVGASSSAFVLHERPPSPPFDPVNEDNTDAIAEFGLAGPSTIAPRTEAGRLPSFPGLADPLVQRFLAIGGIERLFPGLTSDWSSARSISESSPNVANQVTHFVDGINYIPTSPDDPMSIARLTNPNCPVVSTASSSYSATTRSSSAGSTPTSTSSNSSGLYSNGSGPSSINSLFLGASAFAAGYDRDIGRYKRSGSTTSPSSSSRQEAEDEDEDGNNSSSSNSERGPNYTTTSQSSMGGSPPSVWNQSTVNIGSVVAPSPNYSRRPSVQHQLQPTTHYSVGGPQRSRKQQCPECNGWYSNLSAHLSTHLSYPSRPHVCSVCRRGFSRPNDLLRHEKSHQGDAPYTCPYHATDPRCHPSGGFSRCDTYKNHLKSMHFEYPAGTKKKERQGAGGNCKACQMEFDSVEEWISTHVENCQCEHLQ